MQQSRCILQMFCWNPQPALRTTYATGVQSDVREPPDVLKMDTAFCGQDQLFLCECLLQACSDVRPPKQQIASSNVCSRCVSTNDVVDLQLYNKSLPDVWRRRTYSINAIHFDTSVKTVAV